MAQTTYNQYNQGLLPGTLADGSFYKIDSYIAEGALGFGVGVVQGTTDREAKLAVASGKLLGVTVRSHAIYANDQATDIKDNQMVGVLTRGVITGEITGTIAKNAAAYIEVTAGADQGKFTDQADSGTNLLVGKFLEGGADGDVVNIEVQL